MRMQREMKSKITKDNLLRLKEKKVNQLRVNKIRLNQHNFKQNYKKKNSKDSNGKMQTSGLIITKESFTIIAKLPSRMTKSTNDQHIQNQSTTTTKHLTQS